MNTNKNSLEHLDTRLVILELIVARLLAAQDSNPQLNPATLQQALQLQVLNITQRPRQVAQEDSSEAQERVALEAEVRYTICIDQFFRMVQIAIQSMKGT